MGIFTDVMIKFWFGGISEVSRFSHDEKYAAYSGPLHKHSWLCPCTNIILFTTLQSTVTTSTARSVTITL